MYPFKAVIGFCWGGMGKKEKDTSTLLFEQKLKGSYWPPKVCRKVIQEVLSCKESSLGWKQFLTSQGKDSAHERDACDSEAACCSRGEGQETLRRLVALPCPLLPSLRALPVWPSTHFTILSRHPSFSLHSPSHTQMHTVQWKHTKLFQDECDLTIEL